MTSDYAGFTDAPARATQKPLLNIFDVDTDAQVVSRPTCTGEDRVVVFPWPSRPLTPDPHNHKVPSVLTAAAKSSPDDDDAQLVNAPT